MLNGIMFVLKMFLEIIIFGVTVGLIIFVPSLIGLPWLAFITVPILFAVTAMYVLKVIRD